MQELLGKIKTQALAEIEKAASAEALYQVQVKYLGRKGELTLLMQGIADLPKEEKPAMGRMCNEIKQALEEAFARQQEQIDSADIQKKLSDAWVDVTAPGAKYNIGHIHPLSQVQYEVEQIFSDMGFAIMDGPEAESEYYNFEGLNIPSWHPARDMQDTFFLKQTPDKKHGRLVLRTQTSPVQVRTMEKYGAPLRIIVPGRVFRNEATDASHEHTFSQVEGLLVDRDISLAHLKGVMREFLTRLFGRAHGASAMAERTSGSASASEAEPINKGIRVRFRPGYFPFVEPGVELDMSCLLCNETGCRVCKHTGWLEFMGAGMVHPNVLKAGGIDSKKYQGWAFGFGLTRLVMMRYGIDDIRLLSSGDLRFLEQF
ncbi:phenylalanine--tRNA ligase subunit alpha [Candidatus Peregrinibacteria bacterium]|nr:phenylalanine--tRNA ligase subunit alpha [Candidatus Peregrinibacteria bacterium]